MSPNPMSAEALQERELVLSAQAGDHTAFAGLVRRHQRRALQQAHRHVALGERVVHDHLQRRPRGVGAGGRR